MVNPLFLFHASPYKDLKLIEPRKDTAPEGFDKGPVVFATDNLAFSTQFLVSHDDSWANGGTFGDTTFFVISDKERFKKADKGGYVYLVSSEGFCKYNKDEWFNRKSVVTRGKIHFDSGLTAMLVMGVQVYFVTPDIYQSVQNSPDHGIGILNSLKSKNERLGLPFVKLDLYRSSKKINVK